MAIGKDPIAITTKIIESRFNICSAFDLNSKFLEASFGDIRHHDSFANEPAFPKKKHSRRPKHCSGLLAGNKYESQPPTIAWRQRRVPQQRPPVIADNRGILRKATGTSPTRQS